MIESEIIDWLEQLVVETLLMTIYLLQRTLSKNPPFLPLTTFLFFLNYFILIVVLFEIYIGIVLFEIYIGIVLLEIDIRIV